MPRPELCACFRTFVPHRFENSSGAIEPSVKYDDRDDMSLAVKNPSPFDACVRYNDERHTYAIFTDGEWREDGVVSMTGLLKFGFPETTETKLTHLALQVLKALMKKLERYRSSFVPAPAITQAVLERRHTGVQKRINTEGDEDGGLLRHLISEAVREDKEAEDYDELALFLIHTNVLAKKEDRTYRLTVTDTEATKKVTEFWSRSNRDGTELHRAIEMHLNDRPFSLMPHLERDFVRFLEWYERPSTRAKYGEPYRTEMNVCYAPLLLAGQIDAVFYKKETDEYTIVDWKRTKNPYKAYPPDECYVKYGETSDGVWEVLNDPSSSLYDSVGKPYGTRKIDKNKMQIPAYKFAFEQQEGKRVTTGVVVIIEPRKSNVSETVINDFTDLDRGLCALLNERAKSLFRTARYRF